MIKTYNSSALLLIGILMFLICNAYAQSCKPFDVYVVQQNLLSDPDFDLIKARTNYQINCQILQQPRTYQVAPDKYMHLSLEQINNKYGAFPIKLSPQAVLQMAPVNTNNLRLGSGTLPASLDLRASNWVSPVQNQALCGSCLAFSSIALYQSYLLKNGFNFGLSEQAALQCVTHYSVTSMASDCNGGYFDDYLNYHKTVGNVLRTNYPYISGNWGAQTGYRITPGICAQQNRIMLGPGTVKLYPDLTATQIKTLLVNQGSLLAAISIDRNFELYTGGVYNGCPANAASNLNHAVLIIGYDDSTNSWLIKNSWGTGWGQSGFMKVSMSNDCGLTKLVGNIQFSSINANPSIVFTDTTKLFAQPAYNGPVAVKKSNPHMLLTIFVLIILLLVL